MIRGVGKGCIQVMLVNLMADHARRRNVVRGVRKICIQAIMEVPLW